MRILIAEDDAIARMVLEDRITQWGYEAICVGDGSAAMKILEAENPPQLVILDWVMPGMDGLQICRRIRAQSEGSYVYVLLLTSKNRKKDLLEALEAGADDFISKPSDTNELRLRLNTGKRIIKLQNELRYQITHDFLTGLWNRFAIVSMLEKEINRSIRYEKQLSIAMVDMDRFKQINDKFGHQVGDTVLCEASSRMMASLRSYDAVGRYGGEEFLLVFPESGQENARQICEKIRLIISDTPVPLQEGMIWMTASIGVATMDHGEKNQIDDLIKRADDALYCAKENGRNRIEISVV